ncbi:TRAP transporter small permease [Salinicola endophyticus]|uniref:TRAP transporter small permease n=1 Tax=Salinicola endophyticus TaxID=1949083 RepID=UPI0013006F25|nr:TRAP transporter small permease [Salinicola endophyticus]
MSAIPSPPSTEPASAGSLFDVIATGVRCLAGLGLIALVILVSAEIVSRFFFAYSLRVVEELAGYIVVGLTLFGASLAVRKNSLFQVGFLFDALPHGVKRLLNLVYLMLSLAVCGVLIWYALQLVESSYTRGNVAPTFLMTPLWMPQLLIPLGLTFIAVFLVERMILTLRQGGTA